MKREDLQAACKEMESKCFRYLIDEYGFKKVNSSWPDPDMGPEGLVEYVSPTTFVTVSVQWYGTEVVFGRVIDDRKFSLSTELVHEFLSLTADERTIVCAPSYEYTHDARMLVISHQLKQENLALSESHDAKLQQIINHAVWLRQYADPFLRGDFRLWRDMFEYWLNRELGERGRKGLSNTELWTMKAANRKPRFVRQYVFQAEVDYLRRLKHEMKSSNPGLS